MSDSVLDMLSELNQRTYLWMEYGLQSIHDRTLELINRGHKVAAFIDAVERSRQRNLQICVHVILGLPEEDKRHMLDTARALGRLDIQGVKVHLLYVIKGTALAERYLRGGYPPRTRTQTG